MKLYCACFFAVVSSTCCTLREHPHSLFGNKYSGNVVGKNFSLLKMPPALFAKNLYLLAHRGNHSMNVKQ